MKRGKKTGSIPAIFEMIVLMIVVLVNEENKKNVRI
jgi:hypothetical protein